MSTSSAGSKQIALPHIHISCRTIASRFFTICIHLGKHTIQVDYKKHQLTPRYIGNVILVQGETLLPVPSVQCICVHFSQQAGMPTFQIVPTLHLNIALLALWGHHSCLQDKPTETEYLYLCTIIGTIQTHRSQIQMQAILQLKIHGHTQPLGKRGEGSYAYVVNTSGLIAQVLRVMVTSF